MKKSIIPCIITVILFMVFLSFYKVVYAINDDLMIESVLSGSFFSIYPYTYYLSVPIGTVIAALYSMFGKVPWFGIFIEGSLFISVFAIEYVAVNRGRSVRRKIVSVIAACLVVITLLSSTIVLPHYTVVAAILGGAGLVLFMSSTDERQFVAPIVFFVLTYLVRENVFFMLVPFIGIAFIYLLITNRGCNIKAYILYALAFFVASIIAIGLNKALLTSDEWKQYMEFNDIRTDVYDYVGIIQNDEEYEYYESQGYDRKYIDLIRSYDIILSDIDEVEAALKTIAGFAHKNLDEKGTSVRLKEAFDIYKYRVVRDRTDFPYNYIVIGLYVAVAVLVVVNKRWLQFVPLIFCGIYRCSIWMFLIYRGRYPERVTLSLYILEIFILVCMVARSVHMEEKNCDATEKKRGAYSIVIKHILIAGVMVGFTIGSIFVVKNLNLDYKTVTDTNSTDDVLYSYMYDHSEDFFFLDVYATVARTKPVLEISEFSSENYMLLGGWMIKHPLLEEKLKAVLDASKASTVCEALKKDSRLHIVVKEDESASIEELSAWVGSEAVCIDSIEAGDATFYVYSFCE